MSEQNNNQNLQNETGDNEVDFAQTFAEQETSQNQQIENLKQQAQDNLRGWQRAQADFENYKKRQELQQKDLLDFAKEVTLVKILPTLESLEQGLKNLPAISTPEENQKLEQWKSGIAGVLAKLDKTLQEMGVQKISALGQKFDPHLHEAVRQVEGDEDDLIVEEMQTGYELNGKVIRPSQVVISKKN